MGGVFTTSKSKSSMGSCSSMRDRSKDSMGMMVSKRNVSPSRSCEMLISIWLGGMSLSGWAAMVCAVKQLNIKARHCRARFVVLYCLGFM